MRTVVLLAVLALAFTPLAVPTASATSCEDAVGGHLCYVILGGLCSLESVREVSPKATLDCYL